MATFHVGKDFETSAHAGAGGMFQVYELFDDNENDVTSQIDVGIHFRDDDHLKEYLSQKFGVPKSNIDLIVL